MRIRASSTAGMPDALVRPSHFLGADTRGPMLSSSPGQGSIALTYSQTFIN